MQTSQTIVSLFFSLEDPFALRWVSQRCEVGDLRATVPMELLKRLAHQKLPLDSLRMMVLLMAKEPGIDRESADIALWIRVHRASGDPQ